MGEARYTLNDVESLVGLALKYPTAWTLQG